MSDYLKKVPWTPVLFTAQLLITCVILMHTMSVKATIREELRTYVTKEEFKAWEENHAKWGEEVILGLRKDIIRMENTINNFDRKLDNLQQRPPPMRPPLQQPRESNGN